jgi:hypothetical protein
MVRHKKFSSPLPNPTKATNAMEEREKKSKRENPQKTLRSRSNASPHKEEGQIGRTVDLDCLSVLPQIDARIIVVILRVRKLKKVNNVGKKLSKNI